MKSRSVLQTMRAHTLFEGGDDLKQLAEADDDDFQEIISLVGMRSKPLHVKRFRKALDDYRKETNPKVHHEISSPPAYLTLTPHRLPTRGRSPDRSTFKAPKVASSPVKVENLRSASPWRLHVRL